MTWGDDEVVYHPADAGCTAAASAGYYDPWADEEHEGSAIDEAAADERAAQHLAELNERDCDTADNFGVLNPPMEAWQEDAVWCMEHGEPLPPRPAEFCSAMSDFHHATVAGVAATALPAAKLRRRELMGPGEPEPGHYGADWLEGPDDDYDDYYDGHARGVKQEPGPDVGLTLAAPVEPDARRKQIQDGGRRLAAFVDDNFYGGNFASHAPRLGAGVSTSTHSPAARTLSGGDSGLEAPRAARPFGPAGRDRAGLDQPMEPKLQRTLAFAHRLGLLADAPGRESARAGESIAAHDLRCGTLARARQTYDTSRLDTALKWFEEFMEVAQRRPSFEPLQYAGDLGAMQYNQETLDMFAEFVRRRGSRLRGRAGEAIKSDTIQTYVSQIKKLRTHEAHHMIVGPEVNVIGPAAYKRMRQLDGPPGERKLSLGLRARHLREAATRGFDRKSKRGVQEWGAALTAHNLLCRGGEVCVVDKKHEGVDTERDIVIGAVEFKEPSEVSAHLPWLTVEMVPIKDTTVRRRSAVMPVRRRKAGGALGADPLDTFDAIVMAIEGRIGRLPPSRGRVTGPEALLPLFIGPAGQPWCTTDSRRLARRIAGLLGLEEELFGGKSFRIGGATDYRAVYGPDASERMIRQRGRWWSDIHTLYQRALAAEHLEGSAAIGDARGAELEALCKGWSQPSTFR